MTDPKKQAPKVSSPTNAKPTASGVKTTTQGSERENRIPLKSAQAAAAVGQFANKLKRKSLKSGNSIVPPESMAGSALSMVIGIMAFLASLTLGAVIMVNQTASDWQIDISTEVTIQIKPFDDVEMEKAVKDASAIALSFDGVSEVIALDKAANERLLEPWLGSGLDLGELPIPRLLTVTLKEGSQPDFAAMRSRIETEVPGASLDDHRAWVGRLTNMAFATVLIGVGIFSLVLVATILTVVFATRGAMASNRQVVEVLHFVGAENSYIATQFQKHFLMLGFKGSIVGAVSAILLFYGLALWSSQSIATPEGDQISALFGTFSIGWAGYVGILLVLLLIAALTAFTSRYTVHRYVQQLHRYGGTKKD